MTQVLSKEDVEKLLALLAQEIREAAQRLNNNDAEVALWAVATALDTIDLDNAVTEALEK